MLIVELSVSVDAELGGCDESGVKHNREGKTGKHDDAVDTPAEVDENAHAVQL